MWLMKQIWTPKKGKITFCAIDVSSVNADEKDEGPKYKALPQTVQDEIVKISGKSLEQLVKDRRAFDREAAMGVYIAQLARYLSNDHFARWVQ